MTRLQFGTIVRAVVLGLVVFAVVMGMSLVAVSANARLLPSVIWFPAPVTVLIVATGIFAERRWRIGLAGRVSTPTLSTVGLTIGAMLIGGGACILQGAWFGLIRESETFGSVASSGFQFAYAVTFSVLAAVLAEIVFRGIVQTRVAQVLGAWPAILLVAAINTAAHRWGPDLAAQWLAYFASLTSLGWLRHVTGSLWPPIAAHATCNLTLAARLWWGGPFDHGAIGTLGISVAAVALAAGVALSVRTREGSVR